MCPFIAPPFAVTHYDTSWMEGQAKLTLWLVTCLDGLSSSTGWRWVTTTFIKPDYRQSHRLARVIGTARIVCESMKWSGVCPSLSVVPSIDCRSGMLAGGIDQQRQAPSSICRQCCMYSSPSRLDTDLLLMRCTANGCSEKSCRYRSVPVDELHRA